MRCPTLSELPPPPEGKTGWPWTVESKQLPDTMPDGSPWPRISIVTPSYNQGQFIEETIRSVLLQGYPDLEYIIIDGGSTDESVEIIKKYSPWLKYWVSEPDKGQSNGINKGFDKASGDVYAWINSDDIYCQGALKSVGENIEKADVVVGGAEYVDENLEHKWDVPIFEITHEAILSFVEGMYLPQPSVFFSSCAFRTVGSIREDLHYTMDLDLWLRLSETYSFYRFENKVSLMRYYGGTKTSSGSEYVYQEYGSLLYKYRANLADSRYRDLADKTRKRIADFFLSKVRTELCSRNRGMAVRYLFRSLIVSRGVLFSKAWVKGFILLIAPSWLYFKLRNRNISTT